jgi:hypothetical protein
VGHLRVTAQSTERAALKQAGDLCRNRCPCSRRELAASNHMGDPAGNFDGQQLVTFCGNSFVEKQGMVNFAFGQLPISIAGLSRAHG